MAIVKREKKNAIGKEHSAKSTGRFQECLVSIHENYRRATAIKKEPFILIIMKKNPRYDELVTSYPGDHLRLIHYPVNWLEIETFHGQSTFSQLLKKEWHEDGKTRREEKKKRRGWRYIRAADIDETYEQSEGLRLNAATSHNFEVRP